MNIWIDLANSPQVLFLRPIIAEMERQGHSVLLTSRDYAQTIPLADHYGMSHTPIGKHGGKQWSTILTRTFARAQALAQWARIHRPIDLAVSHNSIAQAIAAARVGIPFVTLMDYEHQPANHLCFRLAKRVIVPECFPETKLQAFGAKHRVRKFAGIKEQLYLANFQPQPHYFETLGVPTDKPVVVMRPPAPWAAYHRKFRDTLFDDVLGYVAAQRVTIVFTPRVQAQADEIQARHIPNVWIPPTILDGPNLVYQADAVISGGGTMNREAGVLGTPAYTVFAGKLGAVDEWLIARGRMTHVRGAPEFANIGLEKNMARAVLPSVPLVQQVTDMILETIPQSYSVRAIRRV